MQAVVTLVSFFVDIKRSDVIGGESFRLPSLYCFLLFVSFDVCWLEAGCRRVQWTSDRQNLATFVVLPE